MPDHRSLENIKIDDLVDVVTDDGGIETGQIKQILSKNTYHFSGIKVELENGTRGRIQKFTSTLSVTEKLEKLEKEFRAHLHLEESDRLEFKATFIFNLKAFENCGLKRSDADGPHSIAKTIAAFANKKGGTLYIGIKDEPREILGLSHDYQLLQKESNSEFFFNLKKKMDSLLTPLDYSECVEDKQILHLNEGNICMIQIKPIKRPVIINGLSKPEFYVRSGDQSIRYDDPQAFCHYWCEHLCTLNN